MCATQCDAGDVRTMYCDPTTDLIHVLPTTSPSLIRSVLEITVTASTIFGPSLARDMDANKNDGPSREMEKRWSMYGQISADGSDYQRTPIHIPAPPPQRLHTDYSNGFNELSCPSVTRIYHGETRATSGPSTRIRWRFVLLSTVSLGPN